jgi:hypothetical protein
MKFTPLRTAGILLLYIPIKVLGTACQTYYTEDGDPSITGKEAGTPQADLVCEDFEDTNGDLHAVVFGCSTVNQEVPQSDLPPRVVTTSFTQVCRANVGEFTTFTCYDMAPETSFAAFQQEADGLNLYVCEESDKRDSRECSNWLKIENRNATGSILS